MNSHPESFDGLLAAACSWLLVGCAAWSVLICAGALLEAWSRGRFRATAWVGCPPSLSRLLLAGLGVALVSAPGPAAATAPVSAPRGQGVADPSGVTMAGTLPTPARPLGPARVATSQVWVRPGDTLWQLAEDRLKRSASPAEIADLVVHLHQRNRTVIGSDPDLIRPGQRLAYPAQRLAHARLWKPSRAEPTPRGEQ